MNDQIREWRCRSHQRDDLALSIEVDVLGARLLGQPPGMRMILTGQLFAAKGWRVNATTREAKQGKKETPDEALAVAIRASLHSRSRRRRSCVSPARSA